MLQAVVGIQVAVQRIEGKAKLSQNREERDRLNAADTLLAKGAEGLGQAMRTATRA
jgi:transcriptional regulator